MNRFVTLLFGLVLFGAGGYLGKQQLELHRHGLHAIGTVLDAKTMHEVHVGPDGVDSSSRNTGSIEFVPEGGTQAVRFSADFWLRPSIGSEVRVLYLREDPAHAKLDTWLNWLWPPLLGGIGAWCLLAVLGVVSDENSPTVTTDRSWTIFRWFD